VTREATFNSTAAMEPPPRGAARDAGDNVTNPIAVKETTNRGIFINSTSLSIASERKHGAGLALDHLGNDPGKRFYHTYKHDHAFTFVNIEYVRPE
jgi:hypothetical protein